MKLDKEILSILEVEDIDPKSVIKVTETRIKKKLSGGQMIPTQDVEVVVHGKGYKIIIQKNLINGDSTYKVELEYE